jgi:catechol 2,3-dioxygenase-like lactoylglutathione lyase family enzyme
LISGVHLVLYSRDAEADREFFRDVLKLSSVDVGDGWLVFAMPPAELAVHPAKENDRHEVYLMCDDLEAAVSALKRKRVKCSPPRDLAWGRLTMVRLPGGGEVGLYQPKHALAQR